MLSGRRGWLLALGGAVLLAAVAVVVVLLVGRDDSSAAPARAGDLPAARLAELETSLVSPDPSTQAGALDPAVLAALQQSGQPLLPPGSTLAIDGKTARVSGHTATVSATVSGTRSGRFTLELVQEDGTWVVFAAEPA